MNTEFDVEKYRAQIKQEIGLTEIPYEKLKNFKVSPYPTEQNVQSEDFVCAQEYVDKEVENLRELFEEFLKEQQETKHEPSEYTVITFNTEQLQEKILENKIEEKPIDNYFYYDVSANGVNLTVLVYKDLKDKESSDRFTEQSSFVKKHFTFIKERPRDHLTGLETMVSFYQFVNWSNTLEKKQTDLHKYEDIGKRMDMVFDGLKLEGF